MLDIRGKFILFLNNTNIGYLPLFQISGFVKLERKTKGSLLQKMLSKIDLCNRCDFLRDLVHFVEFKKHEKQSWRSVTFTINYTLVVRKCKHFQ